MGSETRRFEIANRQRGTRLNRPEIRRLLGYVLEGEGETGGISVAFVGVRAMAALNERWMGEHRPTDVLSFPLGPPPPGTVAGDSPVGDLVVCVPVCEESAQRRGIALHEEVARMLIHGALHLLGHDHATAGQRRRMHPRERRYRDWYRRTGMRVVDR